ncbi:MAG: threonine--tRNA ligase [Patescibacteria group bacterium]|nr:threonine--tRNA ligase [Patescibacteria group bacterium]
MKDDNLHKIRHSLAHIMAAAIHKRYPEAKFGVGPVVENGFYYDVSLDEPIELNVLPKIRKEMQKMISQKIEFSKEDWTIDKAIEYFTAQKQDFKVELLKDLRDKGTTAVADSGDSDLVEPGSAVSEVTIYRTGDFVDLCRGPHVENTSEIDSKAFDLLKVSGAYWRGNEENPQMQRIYGVAFTTEDELVKYKEMLIEAEKRDHRKLGKELDLFLFSDLVGSGLPLFTPRGTLLRTLLGDYSLELKKELGFEEVWVPHMTKKSLYEASGHWDKFGGELFLVTSQETSDELVLKPMNCPHHAQIFASQPRSYKDLPIKYMENTTVYRDEKSGELNGLERVRSITQDDCHTFCSQDQVSESVNGLILAISKLYESLAMPIDRVHLSFRDSSDKYLGDTELWQTAQDSLAELARNNKLEYVVDEGEAAFYGPKIDFIAKDALGRETQVGTIQLDFVQPERFGLEYTDSDGIKKQPVMIHAAILGSFERFLSVYIEHTAGAFPLWLAPEQVRVLPISEKFVDYAGQIKDQLKQANIRVTMDDSNESLGKRIRNSELYKIPYTVIVGEKEQESGTLAVRKYSQGDLGSSNVEEFITTLVENIKNKSL